MRSYTLFFPTTTTLQATDNCASLLLLRFNNKLNMASGYAPQMEKMAGMSITEQREFTGGDVVGDAQLKDCSMGKCPSDTTMKTLCDPEAADPAAPTTQQGIDANQPKGLAEMEAVTVVWTKEWLVGAYAA